MKSIIRDKYPVIASRRKILGYSDERIVENLIKGWIGEEILRRIIAKHNRLSYRYLQNVYLKKGDVCEVDGIILMRHKWVIIEVKHYTGVVRIDGWDTWRNGQKLSNNPMMRTSKMKTIVENIILDFGLNIEVEFIMVFTHPNCEVSINSPFKIDHLTSNQLENYFAALSTETDGNHYSDQEFNQWCDRLHRYSYIYKGKRIDPENLKWDKLENGLSCPGCLTVGMEVHRYKCQCPSCGKSFKKFETVKENIIEYCILHRKNDFTTTEIREFTGNRINPDIISKVAINNFAKKETYRRGCFVVDEEQLQ